MQQSPLSIATVFGTRPEAVKLVPLIRLLSNDDRFKLLVAVTGQHREMLREILTPLGVEPDVDLDIMEPGQSLNDIVCRAMPRLDELYAREKPDMVIVQGDTSSAFCAALSAFHRRIPVAHVEAGLRSFDRNNPYPEESNRRMLSAVADLHFAPTAWAKKNLLLEGVPKDSVLVTGNTVVDALLLALSHSIATALDSEPEPKARERRESDRERRPLVLVTLHRREAWETRGQAGETMMEDILLGIGAAARRRPDVDFVYPVHLNPKVRRAAARILGNIDNVELVDPLPYFRFVQTMARASIIVTDSGGVQEEAPSLGIPVLVTRKTTERPEGVQVGTNHLVGTDPSDVERALDVALGAIQAAGRQRRGTLPRPNPFGDGRAASRIAEAILWFSGRGDAPAEFSLGETGSGLLQATS